MEHPGTLTQNRVVLALFSTCTLQSTKNLCCLRGQQKSKEQVTQQTVFRSNLVVIGSQSCGRAEGWPYLVLRPWIAHRHTSLELASKKIFSLHSCLVYHQIRLRVGGHVGGYFSVPTRTVWTFLFPCLGSGFGGSERVSKTVGLSAFWFLGSESACS